MFVSNVSDFRDQLPSGRALWALLWRSIVFFPLAIVIYLLQMALVIAVLMPFCVLATWTIAFALMDRWWEATACAIGLIFLFLLGRAWCTRATAAPAKPGDGGYVL